MQREVCCIAAVGSFNTTNFAYGLLFICIQFFLAIILEMIEIPYIWPCRSPKCFVRYCVICFIHLKFEILKSTKKCYMWSRIILLCEITSHKFNSRHNSFFHVTIFTYVIFRFYLNSYRRASELNKKWIFLQYSVQSICIIKALKTF